MAQLAFPEVYTLSLQSTLSRKLRILYNFGLGSETRGGGGVTKFLQKESKKARKAQQITLLCRLHQPFILKI